MGIQSSSSQRKIGRMAAKGVLCLVLLSGLGLALARSYNQQTGLEWVQVYPPPQPASHFVSASTPSLGLPTNGRETRVSSVVVPGLASAMLTATPTVATYKKPPAQQGASLPRPVVWKMGIFCRACRQACQSP